MMAAHVVTTTADPPATDSLLLRVVRSDTGWLVTDFVTTRFGYGATLSEALAAWCDDLAEIAELSDPLGPPIATEAAWARTVMGVG